MRVARLLDGAHYLISITTAGAGNVAVEAFRVIV